MPNESPAAEMGKLTSHLDHNWYTITELAGILDSLHYMCRWHNGMNPDPTLRQKKIDAIRILEDRANELWDKIMDSLGRPVFRPHWGAIDTRAVVKLAPATRFDIECESFCAPADMSVEEVEKKIWLAGGIKYRIHPELTSVNDRSCLLKDIKRIHYVCVRE